MKVREAAFNTCVFTLHVDTGKAPHFVDVTERVTRVLKESEVQNGFALVFSKHTTAAIMIQEDEPLLLVDMKSTLERFSPSNAHYRHNDFDVRTVHMHENECPNGHSHCQHMVLGSSETIPVIDGSLALGEFQRVFVVELDPEKTRRQVLVQIMGV